MLSQLASKLAQLLYHLRWALIFGALELGQWLVERVRGRDRFDEF